MKNNVAKLTILVFCVGVVLVLAHINKPLYLTWLLQIQSLNGLSALLILSIIYILSNLFILPLGLPINLLAGVLWGTRGGGR